MKFERELSAPNEVFAPDGAVFPHYRPVLEEQRGLGISGEDKTHPTDYVPRVIPAPYWERLERGLAPDAHTVKVVPGAMSWVAAPGSRLVNISSGGKMKDTWVLG